MVLGNNHFLVESCKFRTELLGIFATYNIVSFTVDEKGGDFAWADIVQIDRKGVVLGEGIAVFSHYIKDNVGTELWHINVFFS